MFQTLQAIHEGAKSAITGTLNDLAVYPAGRQMQAKQTAHEYRQIFTNEVKRLQDQNAAAAFDLQKSWLHEAESQSLGESLRLVNEIPADRIYSSIVTSPTVRRSMLDALQAGLLTIDHQQTLDDAFRAEKRDQLADLTKTSDALEWQAREFDSKVEKLFKGETADDRRVAEFFAAASQG